MSSCQPERPRTYEECCVRAHAARERGDADAWFSAGVDAAVLYLLREPKYGAAMLPAESIARALTKRCRFHVSSDAVLRAAFSRGHRVFAGEDGIPIVSFERSIAAPL